MAEVSSGLMYEVLRAIQRDVSELKQAQGETDAALVAMRTHLVGLHQDVNNLYGAMRRQEEPLARIERRLEITQTV